MRCPVDNTELRPTDRQGIEIDYCPQCRGVWLDRGELDKLLEKSAVAYQTPPQNPVYGQPAPGYNNYPPQPQGYQQPYRRYDDDDDWDDDDRRYYQQHGQYPPHRRKKGFLGDLFDFD